MKTKFLQRVLWLMIPLLMLFATNAWAENTTVDWSDGSYSSGTITWNNTGYCSIVQERNGSGNTAPNSSYVSAPRWYSGNKITITAGSNVSSFTSIVIEATSNSYATALAGSTYTVTSGSGSVSANASNTTVTITMSGTVTAFTIVMTGQSRLSGSTDPTVYYSASGGGGGGGSTGTYIRIANVAELSDGDQIIFVNQGEAYACSTTQNTNNRGTVAITTSSHTYTKTADDGVQVFTVKISTANTSYYGFHTGDGYIASKEGNANKIETNTTSASTNPSGAFAWTMSASSNVFTILNVQNNTYYLAFNGTSIFSKYASSMTKPYIYKKQADTPSCNADPTIGTASVSSSFTLTSNTGAVNVSSGSCSPGTNCEWTDFGLVWGTTSNPTVSNNKKQVASSGTTASFSNNIQPSGSTSPTTWSAGVTYYVRTYGKNGKAGAAFAYGTQTSFVLRSITFNSNGGSTIGTIYCKSGGTATQPSNPTKTGYTFGGWYQEAELTNAVNWSSTITANKTYYAKWTAKTTTVSFNQNGGEGGQTTTKTATYGSAMPTPITTPTRDGYTFAGYYESSGGTGNQYYTEAGASARNWDKENSTWTLYAKWTPNQYTVTWKSNGVTVRTDNNVNHGTAATPPTISPLPCGDKLAGWTDAAGGEYVHGTSNLYTGATITITGNVTLYAVFADYDD